MAGRGYSVAVVYRSLDKVIGKSAHIATGLSKRGAYALYAKLQSKDATIEVTIHAPNGARLARWRWDAPTL